MTNVLVIVLDDMRYELINMAPYLAGWQANTRGRLYSQARCNVGLCQPFRTAFLSGQLAKDHGEYGNGYPLSPSLGGGTAGNNSLGRWMSEAGYRTGMFGKYMNGVSSANSIPAPTGWDTWRMFVEQDGATPDMQQMTRYGLNDGATVTQPDQPSVEYLRDETIAFMAGAQPWFAYVCPTSPHFPFAPLPGDGFLYSDWEGIVAPDVDPSQPSWYTGGPPFNTATPLTQAQRNEFARVSRLQAREMVGVDRAIAAIMAEVDLSSTVVMVTSDNGLIYGENRVGAAGIVKNDLSDVSLRVPLLCAGPGFTRGETLTNVYSDVDMTATCVAIAGATPAVGAQAGTDLRTIQGDGVLGEIDRPVLHERSGSTPPDFTDSIGGHDGNGCTARSTGESAGHKMKLAHFFYGNHVGEVNPVAPTDEFQLYDLDLDPGERYNLANDPAHAGDLASLDAIRLALLAS